MKEEDTEKWCEDNVYCDPFCHRIQAEITGEIMLQQGRQEVVEYIQLHPSEPFYHPDRWQAKLKEWGIK